jgi:hypothetical protein
MFGVCGEGIKCHFMTYFGKGKRVFGEEMFCSHRLIFKEYGSMDKKMIMEEGVRTEGSREKTIIRTSVIGIIANVLLAAFKAAIGLLTN